MKSARPSRLRSGRSPRGVPLTRPMVGSLRHSLAARAVLGAALLLSICAGLGLHPEPAPHAAVHLHGPDDGCHRAPHVCLVCLTHSLALAAAKSQPLTLALPIVAPVWARESRPCRTTVVPGNDGRAPPSIA